MLSENDQEIPFITHLPPHLQIIRRAGAERAKGSIIKSSQNYT